jgi:hypothetical protein
MPEPDEITNRAIAEALKPGALQKSIESIITTPPAGSGLQVDVAVIKTEQTTGAEAGRTGRRGLTLLARTSPLTRRPLQIKPALRAFLASCEPLLTHSAVVGRQAPTLLAVLSTGFGFGVGRGLPPLAAECGGGVADVLSHFGSAPHLGIGQQQVLEAQPAPTLSDGLQNGCRD